MRCFRLMIPLVLVPVFILSCVRTAAPVPSASLAEAALPAGPSPEDAAVSRFVESLPESERMGLIFLVNIEGNASYTAVETYDGKPLVPGGCILFSFNIGQSAEQLSSFIDSIYGYCASHSLRSVPYVALDQEGGYVTRLRGMTSTLPSAKRVADTLSADEAFLLYGSQARQMSLLGITMNIAPVVEAETEGNREFLDTRSYGDSDAVASYAAAAVRAYEENGIASVVKHFPGNTNTDPHTGLPEIALSYEQVWPSLVAPFSGVISASRPTAVLMSHARVSAVDGSTPACLSRVWTGDILRTSLGFDGIVLSDDIFMAALEKNGYAPVDAAVLALSAGVDVIMLSEKRFASVARAICDRAKEDAALSARLREAQERVVRYKIQSGLLCLAEQPDGSLSVEVSPAYRPQEREGTRKERLDSFFAERDYGEALYRKLFLGEGQ